METLYFLSGIFCLVLIVMYGAHRVGKRKLPRRAGAGADACPTRTAEQQYVEKFLRESA